ncbi:hypothetical protein [Nocardiopsis ganjiahuensis]|uniref:hypothetical protein n=1 Tax=Nocardiopsis ganjiahuensis TaxID=239984 RepID=UPI0003462173|nr:hypothetical protein [Nocardiopsis ganjiahuensis]
MTTQTTSRELQHTAARVLVDLLSSDLPEVDWTLWATGGVTASFVPPRLGIDLLAGQATSHQAVRDWAAYLGTDVELRFGTTPDARAIVDGIVVRVWCAPKFRDDLSTSEG